ACRGKREAVEELQTKSGVKDKTAQYWIDVVLARAQQTQKRRFYGDAKERDARMSDARRLKGEARKKMKETITDEIQEEIHDWLVQQPPDSFAALPENSPLRAEVRPGDHYNVLLGIPGLNVHEDTPIEILHTYLLGHDKYLWHSTTREWDKKREELFAQRLQSSSIDGLSIISLRADYMLQYKNSLIGKHFKALQQLGVFHLHGGLCDPLIFDLWKATGELGALIWVGEISDMDQYVADLEVLIANVLDIWAIIDPGRIIVKAKCHLLDHILADVRKFGPAVLYSTEIFECWNSIFRFCSVLSNHQAPSKDIAHALADLECFKHIVSGGWWKDAGGNPIQASASVREFLQTAPALQRCLGWVDPMILRQAMPRFRESDVQDDESGAVKFVRQNAGARSFYEEKSGWIRCKYLISQSRDVCKRGSWVFYRTQAAADAAAVREFTAATSEGSARVLVRRYIISDCNDKHYNMPVLTPADDAVDELQPKDVLYIFNAQHDCCTAGCSATTTTPVIQEGRETKRTRNVWTHAKTERYILNMHALHNAALLRQTLPRDLTAPKYYVEDRVAKHREISASLRISGPAKRAEAKVKAAETRARNKAAK
ncbi:uncharacterized protein C8Q71DRAFT_706460, partial [Rhodofomes roseus]